MITMSCTSRMEYISEASLERLIEETKVKIGGTLWYHNSSTPWMDEEIKGALRNLCEEDCEKSFRILENRLKKWYPHPLKDVKEFFLKVVESYERPVFESELAEGIMHFQEDFPQTENVFKNSEMIAKLGKFKRRVFYAILDDYAQALSKKGGKYVKNPYSYLKAIITDGLVDGRWKQGFISY